MKNVRRNNADPAGGDDSLETEAGIGDAKQLIHQLARDICNVVFVDTDIHGLTPADAAGFLKNAYPEMNIVLFSLHGNRSITAIPQTSSQTPQSPAPLAEFITQVYDTAMQANITAVQKVFAFFNRQPGIVTGQYGLSPRELQVLDCLVNGQTYKKIAEHCHISVGTVRSHIMNIYRKLDVNSRSSAIVKAMQEKLVG